MKTTCSLRVEFAVGDRPEDAFASAQRLADLLSVFVCFDFNKVECTACPGGSAEALGVSFRRALSENWEFKLAFS